MLLLPAVLIFLVSSSIARPVPDPVTAPRTAVEAAIQIRTHDANRVRLPLTNSGGLANPDASQGLLWNGDTFLFIGSFWVGARIDGDPDLHVSTTAFPAEFQPSTGPAGSFRESGEGTVGGGRAGITGNGDDDRDGATDEDFLNGNDDDGDGRIDEDYGAAGLEMLTTEYRDDEVEVNGHVPLGLRVRQRSMAWNGVKTSDFIGLEYEIENVGDRRLSEIYLGLYLDTDAGPQANAQYWTDDLAGFATIEVDGPGEGCPAANSPMDILYAWDAPDNGTTIVGGDTRGHFGVVSLGYAAEGFRSGLYGFAPGPDPGRFHTARWTFASNTTPSGGDPGRDLGRYEFMASGEIPSRNAHKPDDFRLYTSVGPFLHLDPGDRVTVAFALVLGNSTEEMIANAITAKRVYDGIIMDGDLDPMTGVDGRETCVAPPDPPETVYWDNPCDSLTDYVIPTFDPCFWIDADCNPCTGTRGRETPLHWLESVPPPLPASNVDPDFSLTPPGVEIHASPAAGDGTITLQWDNASELERDPVSGDIIFEGYRVWRADTYRGRGDLAPPEKDWTIVTEFRLHPTDGRGDDSPQSLKRVLREDRNTVRSQTENGPRYYVGRYEWEDATGIVNGKVYYYAVTPFGYVTRVYPGYTERVEVTTTPVLSARHFVVPQWAAGSGCAGVKVVPNPYHGDAEWDLTPSDCDPSGRKIAFRSLPEGWTSLRIFTLAGDLVLSAGPEDSRVVGGCETSGTTNPGGTFFWDLIGDGGRQVTSGVYLYTLESPGERCKGRFVIIR